MRPNDAGEANSGGMRPSNPVTGADPGGEPMRNRMDDERVAALYDGRLDAHERDELHRQIMADDFELDVFGETAAVLRELEEAQASASSAPVERVIPISSRRPPAPELVVTDSAASPDVADDPREGVISLDSRRRPSRRWAYGAIAAALVALAVAPALVSRLRDTRLDDPARAVAMLDGAAARRPAEGLDAAFGITRGGPGQPRELEPTAVRVGAYLVDLELAAASRDTTVRALSDKVAGLMDDVSGSSGTASVYRAIGSARPGADVKPLLAQGREAVRQAMPAEWLELGVWAEAARTAAARHDAGFFRSRRSRAAVERAAALPDPDKTIGPALNAVRGAIPTKGTPDWAKLENRLTGLLGAAGR
jgi:hypothetical protein